MTHVWHVGRLPPYIHGQIERMVVCLMSVTGQEIVGLNIAHRQFPINTESNKLSANNRKQGISYGLQINNKNLSMKNGEWIVDGD